MRLFSEHIKRNTFLLDGIWQFVTDENCIGEKEEWYKNFPKDSIDVVVPGCINNRLGFMEFQSVAWYKKEFYAEGVISIKFHAVTEYAKVYLDGEFLGEHYGGFTPFRFKKELFKGMHTIVVMVDARSTEDTIPLYAVDWHHYSGIIRSVEVSEIKDVFIESMKVKYTLSDDLKDADVEVIVDLKNYSKEKNGKNLKINIEGTEIYNNSIEVLDELKISAKTKIRDVRLWDIYKGELYTVTAETEDDDLIDKTGFRKIEVKDKKILLNNKPVKVMGVNRHEEHPDWGFAMPDMINAKDMDILKNLNVNAVRGSHYPNTQLFVDMCDKEGILFWSEIPMWGFPKENLERPLVIERGLFMHEEMIKEYYNHPSIVIWGMHNEIATDTKEGFDITKKFIKHVKSLDDKRLITYATNRILMDECLELIDFISVNQYVGWYEGDIKDWASFMDEMKTYLKKKGVDDKPVIMSEFGVGAMFGCKNFEELRWSENYQVEFYKHTLDIFLNDEDISGVYLWQFADIRSNAKWSLLRARSFNNKGILNEYRQPKLAYYAVKEIFGNERNKGFNS